MRKRKGENKLQSVNAENIIAVLAPKAVEAGGTNVSPKTVGILLVDQGDEAVFLETASRTETLAQVLQTSEYVRCRECDKGVTF